MEIGFAFERPDAAQVESWAASFAAARPFPHLVVDDAVVGLESLQAEFPAADWDGWRTAGGAYQKGKRFCTDVSVMPGPLREAIRRLGEPAVLDTLSQVTGIECLMPDPTLDGGGLHVSGPGGVLLPHTDFHDHRLGIYRRLNLLIYLNEAWDESDGGALELFADPDAREPAARIIPVGGRAVLFATDDRSVHGFTEPVAEGRERRSIALYYYTAQESDHYGGDRNTVWRTHGEHRGVDRVRLEAYRGLIKVSRGASKLAFRFNPNRHEV